MNKGLIKYERLRNAVLSRQAWIAGAICIAIVLLLVAYGIGRAQGFDRGCTFSERALEKALVQGIEDGMPYRLQGVSISFRPWKMRQGAGI